MSVQVAVQGTVHADGTLQLDDPVRIPPGRVQVSVQPIVEPPPDDPFWATMQRIWADQQARGHVPRPKEEIDAEIRRARDEAAEEMEAVERLRQECRQETR